MSRIKFKVLWHEPSNSLAYVGPFFGDLPVLYVVDEDFRGMNPFVSYPLSFLNFFGWVEIGEI